MRAIRYLVSAAAIAIALAGPAVAQQSSPGKSLTYEQAKLIAETAYETCVAQGLHVSVHVVGREGETRFAIRGDGSAPDTFENSRRKAYTVRMRPEVVIAGGIPIKIGDEIVGGVGVNGSQRGDKPCAQAGIDKASDLLKLASHSQGSRLFFRYSMKGLRTVSAMLSAFRSCKFGKA
jgi:uncharacterized protein GlcG (DUF336 family)